MKMKAVVSFVLIVLFLISVFPMSTLSGAADSHGSPGLVGSQSVVDSTDWWTMFRHDLTHTGYSTSPAPSTNHTLWSYKTGDQVWSSPAVADGVVYVGSKDDKVYALNAATGAYIWNYTTGDAVWTCPAVVGGVVYVGSRDDKVYALNAATGAYIWNYTTGGWVESSPAVAGGVVYVGSLDHKVYALNAATGAYIWNYTTGNYVVSSPAVAGGNVYVGSYDHKVYALNAATGAYIWNYTTGSIVVSSPAVAGGLVYVGSSDDMVYALNAATGAYIWDYKTGDQVGSSPAVAGGIVYVGSRDDKVYALNAATGAYIWNYTTGGPVVYSSPAVAGGVVFVGSEDNKTYALNAATGALIWSYKTGGLVESSPAVAGGVVYVGSDDSKVYAFITYESIVIEADGTVSPGNAPIQRNGNVYTLTDNIYLEGPILIQKDSIVLDGAGYTLKGPGLAAALALGIVPTGIELSGRQNVTIEYLEIQGFYEGISLVGGKSNTITRTNITSNSGGIYVDSSSSVSILRNNIENNIRGIDYLQNNSGRICENYIANNSLGLQFESANILLYYNSFVNNTIQADSTLKIAQTSGTTTNYNYWSDYKGVDRGDGIGRTPYIIDANNTDLYPLMHSYGAMHDVAITDLTHRTVVDQGRIDEIISQGINQGIINETVINVTVRNQGLYNETFNVTAYYGNGTLTPEMWDAFARMGDVNRDGYIDQKDDDIVSSYYSTTVPPSPSSVDLAPPWGSVGLSDRVLLASNFKKSIWSYFHLSSDIIGTQQVTDLAPGSSESLNFTLNTTDREYQNYTIDVYAQPGLNETETTDNAMTSSIVVTIPGDINGDFISGLSDLSLLAQSYSIIPGVRPQKWNPNADINNDGNVSLRDLATLAQNLDRKLYEHCTAGDNSDAAVNSTGWYAQTFTVGTRDEPITSVKLKLYQGAPWASGAAGNVTVSIRATNASGYPTGQDLVSGTIDDNSLSAVSPGQFYDIRLTLSANTKYYTLSANTKYAIVVEGPSAGSNSVVLRMDSSPPTYNGGNCMSSSDSGANWNVINGELMFAVWYVYL